MNMHAVIDFYERDRTHVLLDTGTCAQSVLQSEVFTQSCISEDAHPSLLDTGAHPLNLAWEQQAKGTDCGLPDEADGLLKTCLA